MEEPFAPLVNLDDERRLAYACAKEWGVHLEPPFKFSNVSYVAPTKDGAVVKVSWGGDEQALHEGDALELWNGDGAVRLLRRSGRALLEERALPGDDLSGAPEDVAIRVASAIAVRLWRPAVGPFRSVAPYVERWIDQATAEGSELAPLARELFSEVGGGAEWVVHGDLHHHNIVRSGERYVAIDPKPYLADREYDVASFLWNPMDNLFEDEAQTERRIKAFVAIGLDEFRIRAWAVIRGSYLRTGPTFVKGLRAIMKHGE
jgi:streptomycin 6-kinase